MTILQNHTRMSNFNLFKVKISIRVEKDKKKCNDSLLLDEYGHEPNFYKLKNVF